LPYVIEVVFLTPLIEAERGERHAIDGGAVNATGVQHFMSAQKEVL
jgi:hypothetical protein